MCSSRRFDTVAGGAFDVICAVAGLTDEAFISFLLVGFFWCTVFCRLSLTQATIKSTMRD